MWRSLLGAAGAELLPDTAPLGGQAMIRLIPVAVQTGRSAAQAASHCARACQRNASDPLPKAIPPRSQAVPTPDQPFPRARDVLERGALTPCAGWRQLGTSVTPCQPRGKGIPVSVPEPSDVSFLQRRLRDKSFSLIYSISVTVKHSITILETALQKNSIGKAGRTCRARRCWASLPLPRELVPPGGSLAMGAWCHTL